MLRRVLCGIILGVFGSGDWNAPLEDLNILPKDRPGIITNGVDLDFENSNISPWTFMKGLHGQASLEIGGDRTNHYAQLSTHGLHMHIENNNPLSPRDAAKLTSAVTHVRNPWYRRYCFEMMVLPKKASTQFNITVLWTDEDGEIEAEYKIFRVYTKDHGETKGTCHGPATEHANAVCIPSRDDNGNPVWTPLRKLKMNPKSQYLTFEIQAYKDSDFAMDSIKLTDCSLDPDVDQKPKWLESQENTGKGLYNGKFGSYYKGLSFEAEERIWARKRAEMKAQREATSNSATTTTRRPAITETYRPRIWTVFSPKPTQKPTQKPASTRAAHTTMYKRDTTRPVSRTTHPTPSRPRPTLPSDWGPNSNKNFNVADEFIPFALDAETTIFPLETTDQTTTTGSLLAHLEHTKSKKLTKRKGSKSSTCKLSIYISLILTVLLL